MNFYIPDRKFAVKSITSAFRMSFKEYYYYTGEAHNDWEMLFIEKGCFTVMEDERTYSMSANQAIFHKPMEFHQFKTEIHPNASIIVICFISSGELIDGLGDGIFELNRELKELLLGLLADIQNTYDYSSPCELRKKEKNDSVMEILTLSKLEAFLLSVITAATLEKHPENTREASSYKQIISVMQAHLCEKMSVEQIAYHCKMSASNLKKIFKKHIDGGIMDYFNKLKILRAMELLKEGRNIVEVSDSLSFSSPNYFSAVFRRETGILPSQYRKNPYDNKITLKMP